MTISPEDTYVASATASYPLDREMGMVVTRDQREVFELDLFTCRILSTCQGVRTIGQHVEAAKDAGARADRESISSALERLISRTAFQLKGSGWYKDLYSSSKPESKSSDTSGSSSSSGDSGGSSSGSSDSSSSSGSSGSSSSSSAGSGSSGGTGGGSSGSKAAASQS